LIHTLLTVSFVAGLIPAVLFVAQYAFRSEWRATPAGRAVMALMGVIAASYALGVVALVRPTFFLEATGLYVALAIRLIIAVVLWNLWWVLWKAQREDSKRGR
jgi:hypothetical protein